MKHIRLLCDTHLDHHSERHRTGDISKWDVSSVTDMNVMFVRATSFNADFSERDVSRDGYHGRHIH